MDSIDPLILIPLVTGPVFVVAGIVMRVFPPKKINHLYGYRTPASMKDEEHWNFAQQYSARKMIFYGVLLTASSVLGLFVKLDPEVSVFAGLALMIGMVVILLVDTERAIRKKFNRK